MGSIQIPEEAVIIIQNWKIWNREVFGSITQQKEALSHQLDWLDKKESDSGLYPEELPQRIKFKEELIDIVYKEEIRWQQKSRIHWLKKGDCSTKFFHKVAKGRKARNLVSSLYVDGYMVEDIEQIEKELISHVKTLSSKRPLHVAWFEKWKGKMISKQSVI